MKIIFKTRFGSTLYGTSTPQSDIDYKGVFTAPLHDIILGKASKCIQDNTKKAKGEGIKNGPDDIDCEYKELREFIKDCETGQTYALDMLFAPEEFWIEATDEWRELIKNRKKLLSKNVQPYIGYCRRQAAKYGLKGSRLGELIRAIEFLELCKPKIPLFDAIQGLTETEFVRRVEQESLVNGLPVTEHFLEVLGKKFQLNRFVDEVLDSLYHLKARYGARAELAMNNEGIDWKAISHAYRCCYQLEELAETGEIKFPLKDAERLRQLKQGAVLNLKYTEIQNELFALMERAVEKVENSSLLPSQPDRKFWEGFIIDTYLVNPVLEGFTQLMEIKSNNLNG